MSEKTNLLDLIKKAIEVAMPDMRHYYRTTRKARVVATYPAEGGNYYADVKPLRNDGSEDPNEPTIPKVEIPLVWGGAGRGVVCPPAIGTVCDLSYYDGDPNYPCISNMRPSGSVPNATPGEFVIQLEPGVEIRIDAQKRIVMLTSSDWKVDILGNAQLKAQGTVDIKSGKGISLTAPTIALNGILAARAEDGQGKTEATFEGNIRINGSSTLNGDSSVSGNSYAGSRSGGSCPH